MPNLFDPYNLKSVTLRNRIAVSPMCQYSAEDGLANDWHHVHFGSLARGGSGLVVVEATAVSPEGRITPADLGIWNEAQAERLAGIAAGISAAGAVPGIQIAHAGRKASANRPWEGDDHIPQGDSRGWETISPSPIAFGGGLPKVPREMNTADIARVQADFVAAAERARDAGFKWLMLHFAHGYLAQSFLSVHANHRRDEYGGSAGNRARFLIETLQAVRRVWPENLPLTARLGVIEYDGRDEETLAEAIALTRQLKAEGLDLLDVSMGFSTPEANIPWGPALLEDVAAQVRREAEIPTATSWYLSTPEIANRLVAEEKIDLAMIGRPLIANPHWPYQAALRLGREAPSSVLPPPYDHWLARYRSE